MNVMLYKGAVLLTADGKVAVSEKCCCNCRAAVHVSFKCPCSGYGGSDSEEASVWYYLRTTDGTYVAPSKSDGDVYYDAGHHSGRVVLTGGTVTVAGEEIVRIARTSAKQCDESMFDVNGLVITQSSNDFGGVSLFYKVLKGGIWHFYYEIDNTVVAGEKLMRDMIVALRLGDCTAPGGPDVPDAYIRYNGQIRKATYLGSEPDEHNWNYLHTYRLSDSVSPEDICTSTSVSANRPSIRYEFPGEEEEREWMLAENDLMCEKFSGRVAAGALFGPEPYLEGSARYELLLPSEEDDCFCGSYLRYHYGAGGYPIRDPHALVVRCAGACTGMPGGEARITRLVKDAPDISVICCCDEGLNQAEVSIGFEDGTGKPVDPPFDLDVVTEDDSMMIKPKVPVLFFITPQYGDGHSVPLSECTRIPWYLQIRVGEETLFANYNGNDKYYGDGGYISCNDKDAPEVEILDLPNPDDDSSPWARYGGAPTIESVSCDPNRGILITGSAKAKWRKFYIHYRLDATMAFLGGCSTDLYPVNLLVDGHVILSAYSSDMLVESIEEVCDGDPSNEYEDLFQMRLAEFTNSSDNPGAYIMQRDNSYPDATFYRPYYASFDSGMNTLYLTWVVGCSGAGRVRVKLNGATVLNPGSGRVDDGYYIVEGVAGDPVSEPTFVPPAACWSKSYKGGMVFPTELPHGGIIDLELVWTAQVSITVASVNGNWDGDAVGALCDVSTTEEEVTRPLNPVAWFIGQVKNRDGGGTVAGRRVTFVWDQQSESWKYDGTIASEDVSDVGLSWSFDGFEVDCTHLKQRVQEIYPKQGRFAVRIGYVAPIRAIIESASGAIECANGTLTASGTSQASLNGMMKTCENAH